MVTIADPLVMPVAQATLTCFVAELAKTAKGAPVYYRVHPGTEVIASLTMPVDGGPAIDECCSGLATVRVERIYPSAQLPDPELRTATEGGATAYAVVMELTSMRCSVQPGANMAPSSADLTAESQWLMDDAAAMRRVACALATVPGVMLYDWIIGDWAPVAAEGGCTGGTLQLTVQVGCAEC